MKRAIFILLSSIWMCGCAAMFVPSTKDPYNKLRDAASLFNDLGRPLPAERLIIEALQIFEQQKDRLGIADAYQQYGFFFYSPGVEKWQNHYRKNGFLDKTATYDTRYDKAIEYFGKASEIYSDLSKYDALTNVQLFMGYSYQAKGDQKMACQMFRESLKSDQKRLASNMETHIPLPDGFHSYQDYASSVMRKADCNMSQ